MPSRKLGVTVLVLSLLSMFFLLVSTYHYRNVIECQTRVNEAFLETIKERATINNRYNENLTKLIDEVFTAGTRRDRYAAYLKYNHQLKIINQVRKSVKYPDFDEVCG